MIYSRCMKEKDYESLAQEGQIIKDIHTAIQMWNPAQHHHRLWEYCLAQKVLREVFGTKSGLLVSDHGCGAGYLGPILSWLGHYTLLYECWTFGNEEQYMLEQMRKVGITRGAAAGHYEMRHRPLCELIEDDKGVDAAFCISTLEHIGEYQRAFLDLIRTVKDGGLVFLTTDFAEDEVDHYKHANLRAGKMFNKNTYEELFSLAQNEGFELLGGKAEWDFTEECRLVNDYGFGAMALIKREKNEEGIDNGSSGTGRIVS